MPGSPRRGIASSEVPSGSAVIRTPEPESSASPRALVVLLATAGGVGFAPFAPGTAGAAFGLLLFLPLSALPLWLYALTVAALVFLGIWAAERAELAFGRRDDGRIVIDEVAGQLVALTPLLPLGRTRALPWLVTGFVLFRVLDIWKPAFVGWCERRFSGGAGVMLDDVAAGFGVAIALAAGILATGATP